MNAELVLVRIARAFAETRLKVIMIGNAAAALHGAPVTTLDIEFFWRPTPGNRAKLKEVARQLGGTILRPYYPLSDLFRLAVDESALQLDFLGVAHGIRSFAGLRARAVRFDFGGHPLWVASAADLGLPQQQPAAPKISPSRTPWSVPSVSKRKPRPTRAQRLAALAQANDDAVTEQIRRLLALPPN